MTPRLILASGSRYKRALLEQLGLPFEGIDADIDETPRPGEAPAQLAERLAAAKAEALGALYPDAYILGGDQVIAIDDQILHKPGTVEAACAQLAQLQGRTHDLICAIALRTPDGRLLPARADYAMDMRPLTTAQIEDYIREDMPLDCAGSFRLESRGIRLFRAMRGDDHTAIIGLPLTRVWDLLEASGVFRG